MIERLKPQRKAIQTAIAEGKHIVYGYLRRKSSRTSSAGSPYYIGYSSNDQRPYGRHYRDRGVSAFRCVPIPPDDKFIRLFAVLDTADEAYEIERKLIAHYGRKRIDCGRSGKAGILLNRSEGGEYRGYISPKQKKKNGARLKAHLEKHGRLEMTDRTKQRIRETLTGVSHTSERVSKIARSRLAINADALSIPVDKWDEMSRNQRMRAYRGNKDKGLTGDELIAYACRLIGAEKFGIPQEVYDRLSQNQRVSLRDGLKRNPDDTGETYCRRQGWM